MYICSGIYDGCCATPPPKLEKQIWETEKAQGKVAAYEKKVTKYINKNSVDN